jgi:hypothetical protein
VRHATHTWLPADALKVLEGQLLHVRSEDALGAAVSYVPAAHVVIARHTRSAWPVGAANVYWPLGHAALCVRQSRSMFAVGALCSYSSDAHTVTGMQAMPVGSAVYGE